jgi:hypothetical protein
MRRRRDERLDLPEHRDAGDQNQITIAIWAINVT